MATWSIERLDKPGTYFVGTASRGVQWTDWRPHRAFGDRGHMAALSRWLNANGFRTKIA